MIKKSFILSLLLVAGYSMLLAYRNPTMSVSNHQWQDNSIKAQTFLYKKHKFDRVIVGSSLSSRLVMDSLPNYYNLCFAGMSVFEGLKLLSVDKDLPDVVFIEMNTIFNAEDKAFTSTILNPLFADIKKYTPALRDGKQPLSHFKPVATSILTRVETKIKKAFPTPNTTASDGGNLFQIALQPTIDSRQVIPDQPFINATFTNLDKYVSYLVSHKVKVVFFELPMNPVVADLPYFKVLRRSFLSKYPSLPYLPTADCRDYKTTDGLHLNPDDAARYTKFFKEESSRF